MELTRLKSIFDHVLTADDRRMVIIGQAPFMIAAVNDGGHASLFARVSLAQTQVLNDGQGFSARTTRSGSDDYVQITASDRGIPPLFLKLAEYVIERVSMATTVETGAEVLIRSIEEYRRFVGQRRGRLPESVVRGTFAELVFLRDVIDAGVSIEVAVTAWRGPWAKAGLGVHDFTFPDGRGIEVKSTHQPPMAIRVSSVGQLVPSQEPLDLLVLPVEEATDGAVSAVGFRQYAQETAGIVSGAGSSVIDTWDAALEVLGLDLTDEWYDRYRFLPGSWRRYRVTDGFPHLDIPSLPGGIVDIRYSLELLRLASFSAPVQDLLQEMTLA